MKKENIEPLYKALAAIINQYPDTHVLAEAIGVSHTTLWRWCSSVNKITPDPYRVLSLLRYHSGLNKVKDIAKEYLGIIGEFVENSFQSQIELSSEITDSQKMKTILKDQYDFVLYAICCSVRGASLDELVYISGHLAAKKANLDIVDLSDDIIVGMGGFARKKLEKLVNSEVLYMKDDHYFYNDDTFINIDDSIGRGQDLIRDFIKPELWNKNLTFFYVYQESIEPETAAEVMKDLYEAYQAAKNKMIKNRSTSKTARPYGITSASEFIWFEKGLN